MKSNVQEMDSMPRRATGPHPPAPPSAIPISRSTPPWNSAKSSDLGTVRSRRAGILLVSGALGYIATFGLIAGIQADRDIWTAAAFGLIPLAVGIGYFLDWSFIRRDARASS